MVFEALSAILTAVRHENDRVASEFQPSDGGSWPAMQPNDNRQVAASSVVHGTNYWAALTCMQVSAGQATRLLTMTFS